MLLLFLCPGAGLQGWPWALPFWFDRRASVFGFRFRSLVLSFSFGLRLCLSVSTSGFSFRVWLSAWRLKHWLSASYSFRVLPFCGTHFQYIPYFQSLTRQTPSTRGHNLSILSLQLANILKFNVNLCVLTDFLNDTHTRFYLQQLPDALQRGLGRFPFMRNRRSRLLFRRRDLRADIIHLLPRPQAGMHHVDSWTFRPCPRCRRAGCTLLCSGSCQ